MSDDERPGNVLAFVVGPSPLMRRPARRGGKPYCRHRGAFVDISAREVTCQQCDADLDPIEVLNQLAHEEMTLIWSREELVKLGKERDELKRDELKREIANLKAQKRRLVGGPACQVCGNEKREPGRRICAGCIAGVVARGDA